MVDEGLDAQPFSEINDKPRLPKIYLQIEEIDNQN